MSVPSVTSCTWQIEHLPPALTQRILRVLSVIAMLTGYATALSFTLRHERRQFGASVGHGSS